MPASSMCSMMPAMKVSLPSAEAIDVDLGGVGQIAVDQQRALGRDRQLARPVEIAGELARRSGRAARRRARSPWRGRPARRTAGSRPDSRSRRRWRAPRPANVAMPFCGWRSLSLSSSFLKRSRSSARSIMSGEVPRIGTLAFSSGSRELERRLAAELHDHAVQRAVRALGVDDLQHVLRRQRLEIEPVGGVVVGRHRLRIAVDHDGFVAGLLQREGGVAAAIVELDALADAVRPAAEDDRPSSCRRARASLAALAGERRLVGRIHVGGRRGELGGAGVDALEHRPHAERAAFARDTVSAACRSACRAGRRKSPCAFSRRNGAGGLRQALRLDLRPRSRRCRASAPGTRDRSGRRRGSARRRRRAAWPARP